MELAPSSSPYYFVKTPRSKAYFATEAIGTNVEQHVVNIFSTTNNNTDDQWKMLRHISQNKTSEEKAVLPLFKGACDIYVSYVLKHISQQASNFENVKDKGKFFQQLVATSQNQDIPYTLKINLLKKIAFLNKHGFFNNLNLQKANFCGADLSGYNLRECDFTGADLSMATLFDTDLSEAIMVGTNLHHAKLFNANLSGAHLVNADLSNAVLDKADLLHGNLFRANLTDAHLDCAKLEYADLSKADLTDTILTGAILTNAKLCDATLRKTNFSQANMMGADLSDAKMNQTKLIETNLTNANLKGVDLDNAIRWKTNLTDVRNLSNEEFELTQKRRPSYSRSALNKFGAP